MTILSKKIILLPLCASLASCSWVGIDNYDRREKYLEAGVEKTTVIPETLDKPVFEDALPVPEASDTRGIAGQKLDVSLPPALSTTFGVEQIVLKKLGEDRWIFLDSPPAMVWPKVNRFWEEHNLKVQKVDPRRGYIESTWLISREGTAEEIYQSLTSGTAWTDAGSTIQNKFRLTIESGIRSGSSEIHLEHMQVPLNAPVRPSVIDWDGESDNGELENELLTKLAYYLGEKINEHIVSLGPTAIREEKAILIASSEKPQLRYKLGFDRAWATVEGALENARITVEDLNRSDAIYFILFDESIDQEPGFFGGLFGGKSKADDIAENKMQLHLIEDGDHVVVTVMRDSTTPVNANKAERLLKILKESST